MTLGKKHQLLIGVIACLAWVNRTVAQPRGEPQFVLRAEVVDVLEGGPLTLKMSLEYRGSKERQITAVNCSPRFVSVMPPADWVQRYLFRAESYSSRGCPYAPVSIQPGDKWTYLHLVHLDYSTIPAGRVTFSLKAKIYLPRDPAAWETPPNLLEEVTVPLTITIPSATPDRVRKLGAKLQSQLQNTARATREEKIDLIETLINTSHKELIPIGLALLVSEEHGASYELLDWMYDRAQPSNSLTTSLIDSLLTEKPCVVEMVFSYWQYLRFRASAERVSRLLEDLVGGLSRTALRFVLSPHRLGEAFDCNGPFSVWRRRNWSECLKATLFRIPDHDWQRLTQAKSLWIRALTYATFPERCDKAWRARLLADLPRLAQPLPPEEFQSLLQQLEHRQFAVRQRATQQLIELGDRVTAALQTTLGQRPSLEVRHRVIRILESHELQAEHPPHRNLLRLLVGRDYPADLAMLQALANGDDNIQLTKDARKLLKEKQAERRRP